MLNDMAEYSGLDDLTIRNLETSSYYNIPDMSNILA